MNPAESAHQFFEALLGGHGDLLTGCYLTITSFVPGQPEPQTRWAPARVDSLTSTVAGLAGSNATGVYFGVSLTRGRSSPSGRLTVADTAGIAFLWLDIDIAGAGHDDKHPKPYAPNLETALAIAHCLGIKPTVVTHTGHGIQAFYRLAQPWMFGEVDVTDDGAPVIDDAKVEADRAAAAALAWEFVTSVRIRAKQLGGWHVDPTGDLARLMRAPGSFNRKVVDENLPVHILECDPDARYDREDFEAVIAPRALLDPYRSSQAATAELAGTDLPGLWAQVQSSPEFVPSWLAAVLESGFDDALVRIFTGDDDERYHNDDSEIDMALVAAVLRLELGADKAAQAVMARRCRCGRKVEKVNPAERTDYLDRTVSKVAARIRAREALAESADAVIEAALVMDDETDAPAEDEADPPITGITSDESTYNENVISLHLPPADEPTLSRPELEPDPEVEYAQAPKAPRQGMDASTPGPPDAAERTVGKQLAAQMGLPAGVGIWAVGIRRMDKHDEIRMWLRRDPSSLVHGGHWRVNTVRGTRWHPKSEWDTNSKMAGIFWHDLHLVVEPAPARAWREEGRTRLYALARRMEEGTPAEVARQSVVAMLRRGTGTSLFSTAVITRDPWLGPDGCWVALDSVRAAIKQAGFETPKAMALIDTLDEMGCKVQSGMSVLGEGEHTPTTDELQWVLLADDLFVGQLAAHVRMRAADRDAQDARAGIKMIGPT